MNIAYFNYEWDPEASTGAGTHLAGLAGALERQGHRVQVIARHRRPAAAGPGRGSPDRPSPLLWEPATYWRSLRDIRRDVALLRRERPDAVLVRHALRFSALAAARLLGVPVVLEVNAPVPYEIRCYRPGMRLLPGVSDWVERQILRSADRVFVVSSPLRDYFIRHGADPDRIAVVPNGADPGRFHPSAADGPLRARFPGQTLVGFAGSFARFHGIELLAEAIPRARQALFVLVGDGPAAGDLRARRYPNVVFLGRQPRERMPAILAAMDLLVAPYPAQDFFYFSPIKLFEYMASGRAVLAPRLGQFTEVIEHGRNGWLYDPSVRGAFTYGLRCLLDDAPLRSRLGAEARRTLEDHYTWDHNAQRVGLLLASAQNR